MVHAVVLQFLLCRKTKIIMADKKYSPNFPDVLGAITGGDRVNINVVQVALAIRPRVIRAGKPFETVLLVQNASDVAVDFVARVRLPEKDADGKKGRFVIKVDKLVVGLEPAQVGYVILPISTLPDTAVSPDYTVSMDVQVKQADSSEKARRIRNTEGGGYINKEHLSEGVPEVIEELSRLNWTAKKSSGFRSTGLEITFGLMSGTLGAITDLKPGWESLWTMADLVNDALMIEKHGDDIVEHVLPKLVPDRIYPVIQEKTAENFEKAGFRLTQWENVVVSKMLTLVLSYAAPSQLQQIAAGHYNFKDVMTEKKDLDAVVLPHWVSKFMNVLNKEQRALDQPVRAIAHFCFEELVQDAMQHAFERIETAIGDDLGTLKERNDYIEQFLVEFRNGHLNFTSVYLPLIIGGITAVDTVVLPDDNMEDAVYELRSMVDMRRLKYETNETLGVFEMTDRLMEKVLLKYGYDAKRM